MGAMHFALMWSCGVSRAHRQTQDPKSAAGSANRCTTLDSSLVDDG